jgi:putative transposase
LPKSTLENWVRVAREGKLGEIGKGQRQLTDIELELAKVKRELACHRVAGRYALMKKMRLNHPVPLMCRVLGLTASGYYAWLSRLVSRRQRDDERLAIEIRAAHKRTRETYGPERLQQELAAEGVQASVHQVKGIHRDLGIRFRQKKKFKATTNSKHRLPIAANLLEQRFTATAPCQIWLTGITYIHTSEGWL